MTYSGNRVEITQIGNMVIFAGILRSRDYAVMDIFLEEVEQSLPEEGGVVDVTRLSSLNARGLKTLRTFILNCSGPITLLINSAVAWQQEILPMLTHKKPNGLTLVSA